MLSKAPTTQAASPLLHWRLPQYNLGVLLCGQVFYVFLKFPSPQELEGKEVRG